MSTLTRLLFRPQDPMTAFRGRLGHEKQVAWSEPVELKEVKAVGRLAGGTVNDVMLTASTGALRRYLPRRGETVDGITIRAGLSLNLRSPSAAEKLGNQAGALLVPLPIGLAGTLERFYTVKSAMDSLKKSNGGMLIYSLLQALGMAPSETQAALVERYTSRESAMVSNVPGPRQIVHIAGAPLETLLFWIPAFGGVGLGLYIVSYAGQIRMGVASGYGLVPDPERIIAEFQVEFEALQASVAKLQVGGKRASGRERMVETMNCQLDDALRVLDETLERQQSASRTQTFD